MAKVLVTGCAGFVGKNLVSALKRRGDFVVGIDIKSLPEENQEFLPNSYITGDIRDLDLMCKLLCENKIEEVYHLASWAITGECARDPLTTYDVNAKGAATVFEACRRNRENVAKIVVSTSDKAFGKSQTPYTEKSVLDPIFIYDTSKACQQMIALSYFRNYGLPIRIVACSNIYGPGDLNLSRIIPNNILRILSGKKAMIWEESSNHIREFVFIKDVIDAFLLVADKGNDGEVYCCGGTEYLDVKRLIEKICGLMLKNPTESIEIVARPVYLKEIEKQYIDSKKLKLLGWLPQYDLEKGLIKSIEYYKKLPEQIIREHSELDVQKILEKND